MLLLLSRVLFTEVVSAFADHRGKGFWLAMLRLPGNFLHEVSHALGFLVCGYRVKRLLLCIFDREGRGSCTPGRAWSPITIPPLAIGMAALMPLVLGSLVLTLAARWLGVLQPETHGAALALPNAWGESFALLRGLDWRTWQTWVFLYLTLSIGAELAPSSTDLRYGLPTLGGILLSLWLALFALHNAQGLQQYEGPVKTAIVSMLTNAGSVLGCALVVTTAAAIVTFLPGMAARALRPRR
ncbi:MAG: hypothetical protein ACM3VW_02635 [Bacteroidota bacterium]